MFGRPVIIYQFIYISIYFFISIPLTPYKIKAVKVHSKKFYSVILPLPKLVIKDIKQLYSSRGSVGLLLVIIIRKTFCCVFFFTSLLEEIKLGLRLCNCHTMTAGYHVSP